MSAYYNEFDPFAAAWLRNLAAANQIMPGRVDERSITEVPAEDLAGVTRAAFFAGIGGWDLALQLAGWPEDREVWTGSCPCQSFSQAGAGKGFDDERHRWPTWFKLIEERRPQIIFGEQVSSPLALAWLDLVQADLEGAGYAFWAVDSCAAGVGAPHIRQRLWFVGIRGDFIRLADDDEAGQRLVGRDGLLDGERAALGRDAHGRGEAGELADTLLAGRTEWGTVARGGSTTRSSGSGRMGDSGVDGDREHARELHGDEGQHDLGPTDGDHAPEPASAVGPWSHLVWIPCRDGKWRPVGVRKAAIERAAQLGAQLLPHGLPGGLGELRPEDLIWPLTKGEEGRVGKLRGFGNAIVPPLAAAFIRIVMDFLGIVPNVRRHG